MMAQFKQFVFVFGHTLVSAYVVLLLTLSVAPIRAQSAVQMEINTLDKRINAIEGLNIDRRLAVIEQILMDLRDNNTMHRLTMGGTSLLIAERVYRAVRRTATDGEKE